MRRTGLPQRRSTKLGGSSRSTWLGLAATAGRVGGCDCGCPVKPGTQLIQGTLLDDSLSAQVRLCLIAQQCGPAEDTALAVLLVTRTLTGGVHTPTMSPQAWRPTRQG